MKKSALMGVVALTLIFSCSVPALVTETQPDVPSVDIHDMLLAGTVKVQTGTGFAIARIDKKTYVLTCWHVVKKSKKAKVTVYLPETKSEVGTVYAVDPENDLALVVVEMKLPILPLMSNHDFLNVKERRLRPDGKKWLKGDRIYSAGYPPLSQLRPALTTFGNVICVHVYVRDKVGISHDCSGWFGFSGGPLVHESGKVIGVAARIFAKGLYYQSHRLWAIPIPTIHEFLEEAGIAP